MAHCGGDVDDAPVPKPAHERHERMAHQKYRGQITVNDSTPFLQCTIHQGLAEHDASVVDEDVHAAKLLLDALPQCMHLSLFRHVRGKDVWLTVSLCHFSSGLFELQLVAPD